MTNTWREMMSEGWHGFAVILGLLCGLAALNTELMPLFLFIGIMVLGIAVYIPTLAVGLIYLGIALDTTGRVGFEIAGLPITISKLAVVATMGVYGIHVVMRGRPIFQYSSILLGLGMAITTMLMSIAVSGMPGVAYKLIAGVVMLTIMTMLVSSCIEREQLHYLIRFMAITLIIIAGWNLLQRADVVVFALDHAWQERSSGAFGDPNFWAAFLIVSSPIIIGGLVQDKGRFPRILLIIMCMIFPASIMQSYSRAGMLALVFIMPGILWILRKEARSATIAFICLLPVMPLVVNVEAAFLRYSTLLNPTAEADMGHGSLSERTELLRAGLALIAEHPITGIGVGMFPMHASYVTAGAVWKVAHNTYVTIWAEQGLPGVFSHSFLFLAICYTGYKASTQAPTEYLRSVGAGFVTGMAGVALMALTLNMMDFAVIYYCIGIGILIEGTCHKRHDAIGIKTNPLVRV